jgi:hypothetical protein
MMAHGDTTQEHLDTRDGFNVYSVWVMLNGEWEIFYLKWKKEPHSKGMMVRLCREALNDAIAYSSIFYMNKEDFQEKLEDNFIRLLENPPDYVIKCECGAEKCKTTHSHWCPLH